MYTFGLNMIVIVLSVTEYIENVKNGAKNAEPAFFNMGVNGKGKSRYISSKS